MIHKKISRISAVIVAFGVHVFIASAIVFTFPHATTPPKPIFVFLGSFLRSDDFMISVRDDARQQQNFTDQKFNLDVRSGPLSRQVDKPVLINRIQSTDKHQYRPEMDKNSGGVRPGKTEDLGIDLAPFPVIRMRIDQNDQD